MSSNAGSNTRLSNLVYEPPRNGPTLWEIGVADRVAAEFFVPDPNPSLVNHLYKSFDKLVLIYTFSMTSNINHHKLQSYGHQIYVYPTGSGNTGYGIDTQKYILIKISCTRWESVTIGEIGISLMLLGIFFLAFYVPLACYF